MKTLYLEKRGCDFYKGDEITNHCDIGNHRLTTIGYSIRAIDGNTYFIDLMHYNHMVTRKVNYKTHKALMHPKYETYKTYRLSPSMQFIDNSGVCWGNPKLSSKITACDFPYTKDGILAAINLISIDKYDAIEIIER